MIFIKGKIRESHTLWVEIYYYYNGNFSFISQTNSLKLNIHVL